MNPEIIILNDIDVKYYKQARKLKVIENIGCIKNTNKFSTTYGNIRGLYGYSVVYKNYKDLLKVPSIIKKTKFDYTDDNFDFVITNWFLKVVYNIYILFAKC